MIVHLFRWNLSWNIYFILCILHLWSEILHQGSETTLTMTSPQTGLGFVKAEETVSILTFNSRRRGLIQLPGYLGSLISNPAASILDVYLIVDAHGYLLLTDCYNDLAPLFHQLRIQKIQDYNQSAPLQHFQSYFKTGILEPGQNDTNRFQRYHTAILKLDMINIVPDTIEKLIILDIDTLVLEDLRNLVSETVSIQERSPSHDVVLFMTAENYQNDSYYTGKYGNHKDHYYRPYGLNSGLIVANLNLMRQANMSAEHFLRIEDEFPKLSDQDVLNTWAYYNPQKIGELSCKWNTRGHVMCFDRDKLFDEKRTDRGIFHGNTKNGISPFIMDPTPEFEQEQMLHKRYSDAFFTHCKMPREAFQYYVKFAKYAPDVKIYDER